MKIKVVFNDGNEKIIEDVDAYEFRGEVFAAISKGKPILIDEVKCAEIIEDEISIEELCSSLELILPDIRWDEQGAKAIKQAIKILKRMK